MPFKNKNVRILIFGFISLILFMDAAININSLIISTPTNASSTGMVLFLVVVNAVAAVIIGYGAIAMDKEANVKIKESEIPEPILEPSSFRGGSA